MISKKDILKMAKRITRRSGGSSERKIMNPEREWLIGVLIFILVACAGGVLNARSYVYYNSLEQTVNNATVPLKLYSSDDAKAAIDIYATRKQRFDELVNTAPVAFEIPVVASSTDETLDEDESDEDTQTASSTEELDTVVE